MCCAGHQPPRRWAKVHGTYKSSWLAGIILHSGKLWQGRCLSDWVCHGAQPYGAAQKRPLGPAAKGLACGRAQNKHKMLRLNFKSSRENQGWNCAMFSVVKPRNELEWSFLHRILTTEIPNRHACVQASAHARTRLGPTGCASRGLPTGVPLNKPQVNTQ